CKAADLVLIPCRPQAFDLTAVETTAGLVTAVGKPAFVIFMGGPQRAPTTYREARELIEGTAEVVGLGLRVAPVMLTQRAIYHHSTADGRTAQEVEPEGKAAQEIAALGTWASEQVNMTTRSRANRKARAA
ncbi:MAG: ParA family protein, partial [Pseudomonadota bacterium]|nr:ParA family protein [Pseudomonadota bacterium]